MPSGLGNNLYLSPDAFLQCGYMGNDTDELSVLAQSRQCLKGRFQGIFIEGAESFIKERENHTDVPAGHLFDEEAKHLALLERLNSAPGINLPADSISRRPSIRLSALTEPRAFATFVSAFDWFLAEVQAAVK